jgi:hypothetical protein
VKHPIFLSYAWDDDVHPNTGDSIGWITYFEKLISARLILSAIKDLELWRDTRQYSDNEEFEKHIGATIERAIALIAITSHNFLESKWCPKELSWFERSIKKRKGTFERDRIVKVVKHKIERELPVPLQGRRGFMFYHEPQIGNVEEFYDTGYMMEAHQQAYIREIGKIVDEIKRLRAAWQPPGNSPNPTDAVTPRLPENRFTVFVARPASDGREPYLKIIQELQHLGYRTVPDPDHPIPEAGTEAKSWFQTAIDQAQVAVHVLTAGEGLRPEGAPPIAELQLRLSAERAAADQIKRQAFRRVLWLPRSVSEATHSEGYRQVLEALRQGRNQEIALFASDERIEAEDFEKFRDEVINVVSAVAAPAARTSPRTTIPVIYIMCAPEDFERAQDEIERILFDAGCEVRLPLREGSEEDKRKDREKYLAENRYRTPGNATLVLWGRASEVWAREEIDEVIRLSGAAPPHTLGLLKLTPMTAASGKFRTHAMTMLDESAGPVATALQRFADQLKSAR